MGDPFKDMIFMLLDVRAERLAAEGRLGRLERQRKSEPLFGDGMWCQNCSKVRVNEHGGVCEACRKLLTQPRCAKCGRAFTAPAQYRKRGSDQKPICRNERECRARAAK